MQAVGIIAEYNPFHNGHKWHLENAKKISGCRFSISLISGNFVQRGEPAIIDKWKRAEMAVLSGVDLVIELPVTFAVRSAQYFASGGIRLLQSLGVVSHVCFGAEHSDLPMLRKIASAADDLAVIENMKQQLKLGHTYAAALSHALSTVHAIPPEILNEPNNILAIEYLRAISKYAPQIIPITIRRQQAHYHDTTISGTLASATAIRLALQTHLSLADEISQALPDTSTGIIAEMLETKRGPAVFDRLSTPVLAKLRTAKLEELEQLPDVTEGLHHKMLDSAIQATSISDLLYLLKSRRYTGTRLQRILTHLLIGTTKQELAGFDQSGPLYARVLAFNQRGRQILKRINTNATVPIISKTAKFLKSEQRNSYCASPLQRMLARDTFATDIYVLSLPSLRWQAGGWDFRHSPIYVP